MEPDPGIPGDLFEYVDSVPGLLDSLEGGPTIDAFNATVLAAAESGSIAPVVADHIVAWNTFKRDSTTYPLDYAVFAEANVHRWTEAGLPVPRSAEFGGFEGFEPGGPATSSKVGRNAPCPCGSGRKSKRCCSV